MFRHVAGLIEHLGDPAKALVVGFVYSDVRGSAELDALVAKLTRAKVKTLNLSVSNRPTVGDIWAIIRLWMFLTNVAAGQPMICHAHSSKAGALLRLLRFLGIRGPLIYSPHSYFGIGRQRGISKTVFDSIESFLGFGGISVCVSASEQRYAKQSLNLSELETAVIYNGVDLHKFRPAIAEDRRRARARFGLPDAAIVIGAVGRYSPQKDPRTFYAAVAKLYASDPTLWFLHCGGGPEFDQFSDWIESQPWRGQVVRVRHLSDAWEAYWAMDLFVLASRYEGFALSAVEAMASGLPLVLTRCAGNEDIATWKPNRISWCMPGDPDDLVAAVRRSMPEISKPGCNHRKVTEDHLSKTVEVEKYMSLYRSIMRAYLGAVH